MKDFNVVIIAKIHASNPEAAISQFWNKAYECMDSFSGIPKDWKESAAEIKDVLYARCGGCGVVTYLEDMVTCDDCTFINTEPNGDTGECDMCGVMGATLYSVKYCSCCRENK